MLSSGCSLSMKWTSRGTSQRPRCGKSYCNAWKLKICKKSRFQIGGSFVFKAKYDSPQSLVVVDPSDVKIFSVLS